jgi:hypothetical protein
MECHATLACLDSLYGYRYRVQGHAGGLGTRTVLPKPVGAAERNGGALATPGWLLRAGTRGV